MNRKIIPVILAAGEGKRFQKSIKNHQVSKKSIFTNKCLIKLDSVHTPLNILIYQLKRLGFEKIVLVGGYNFDFIKEYLSGIDENYTYFEKYKDIAPDFFKKNIIMIEAEPNYVNGPIFTLLSILKHDNIIKNGKNGFIVLPSDTIFRYSLLNRILNKIDLIKKEEYHSKIQKEKGSKSNILFFSEILNWKMEMFPKNLIPLVYLTLDHIRIIEKNITKQQIKVSKLTELIIQSPEILKKTKIISIHDESYKSDYLNYIDLDMQDQISKFQNFHFLN